MGPWSIFFGVVLVGIVPVLSARSLAAAEAARLPRSALYANASISLWVLAALGYLAIRLDGGGLADVFVTGVAVGPLAAWTAGLGLAGLGIFALSQWARSLMRLPREAAVLARLRPAGRADTLWVALVLSPTAGVCEEFLYRGLLLSLLTRWTGSPSWGCLAAAVAFGAAHAYQGWLGAARAALIGLLLALPPVVAGSILPSMTAHAIIDAIGILVVWPLADRVWPAAESE